MIIEINAQTGEKTERELTAQEKAQMQEMQPPEIPYDIQVINLIRAKYTIDEELAINRQRDVKPQEFQIYFEFCEACKMEVSSKGLK